MGVGSARTRLGRQRQLGSAAIDATASTLPSPTLRAEQLTVIMKSGRSIMIPTAAT